MSTVLLVEDNGVLRADLSNALSVHGCRVLTSTDGEDALKQIKDNTVQLVISDLHAPGAGGQEFVRRSREIRPDVPVVITHNGADAAQLSRSGTDYFIKPQPIEEFSEKVKLILRTSELEAQNKAMRKELEQREVTVAAIPNPETPATVLKLKEAVSVFERKYIQEVIEKHNGDKRAAARALGISLSSLYRHLDVKRPMP